MTDKIIILTTCSTEEEARTIARELVESRLAACVQVNPGVTSVYRWQGKIVEDGEFLLVIKSRRDLFRRLEATLKRTHSYETPEIVATPVIDGSVDYLDWIDRSLDEG